MGLSKDKGDLVALLAEYSHYEVTVTFAGCQRDFSIEELYQAFKARLESERETEQAVPPFIPFDCHFDGDWRKCDKEMCHVEGQCRRRT